MLEITPLPNRRKHEWNALLDAHLEATPYHRYEWLKSVSQAYGHEALPLAAIEGNQLVGLLPLISMRRPFNQHPALTSLPFCDVGGPIGPADIQQALIAHATELAKQRGAASLELRLRARQGLGFDFDSLSQRYAGRKVGMLLPLPNSSDTLLTRFKPKLRSQIKKAGKNGLTVTLGNTPELIADFYQVFSRNMRALGSPVHSQALFDALAAGYGQHLVVGAVYLNKQVTAAGIVLKNHHSAAIPWASALAEYNRLAPNMLLYWSFLAHCSDHGIQTFDFGRSTLDEGTFRFKKQWGAEPHLLEWQDVLAPGSAVSSPSGPARKLVEATWRKLPLAVTNQLGPRIRKYISL
ncbi:MAG: FemAB family XrtA/PEP-CTERM system-associated protein [Saccharospirillum sp.]